MKQESYVVLKKTNGAGQGWAGNARDICTVLVRDEEDMGGNVATYDGDQSFVTELVKNYTDRWNTCANVRVYMTTVNR